MSFWGKNSSVFILSSKTCLTGNNTKGLARKAAGSPLVSMLNIIEGESEYLAFDEFIYGVDVGAAIELDESGRTVLFGDFGYLFPGINGSAAVDHFIPL